VRKFARYLERHYPEAIPWIDEGVGASPEPGDIRPKQAPAGACIRESNVSRMRRLIASTYPERYCDWTGNERPIVFVLCSSRSGSTLLRTMLGGHPRLFAPPELRLLGYNTLAEREAAHLGENAMMLEGAIRALMQLHGRTAREAREHMVQLAAEKATTLDYYGLLQDSLDGAILVDKTPSYALHPPILDRTKSCFENARYIHLVRHPLGAIRSSAAIRMDLVSPFRRHVASAGELAEILWLISHQNILRFLARMPAHRQWRVKFEELVRDPEPAMRDVCRLLNLDFHPKMLRPYDDPHERMTDGIRPETRMIGDIRFHEHTRIDASNAERWKAHAREYPLSAMTWDLAESLGYERL
jgi:hypothetical protein